MRYETIINIKSLLSGERIVNETYLKKLRLRSDWYTQTDSTKFIIPLLVIVHPKLNFFNFLLSS